MGIYLAKKASAPAEEKVKLGEKYNADVVGLGHDGEGVAKVNGFTLFVRGVLPGEKIVVRVTALRKNYGFGQLLKIVEESTERVDPPCDIYDQCGGCQLQHLSYEGQLEVKRQQVIDALERIGKFEVNGGQAERRDGETLVKQAESVVVHPTIGMVHPWHYRNKAQVPFGVADGQLISGFYARGSHRIIDTDECLIQHHESDKAMLVVKEIARELGISAYDEREHRGLLRHVVVKHGFATGETMIVLVTNGKDIPKVDEWVGLIREELPQVVSICHNINMKKTNVIFGDETRVLWGKETISDYIGDIQFHISARSFYQVNPAQTEVLYRKAVEYASLTGDEVVIDAYCGIGTISLFMARHAKEVYGVEIVEEAIADAKRNARLNDILNVEFEAGRAEVVMPRWQEQGVKADVVVVDPPRKGCERELLDTIVTMQPERVVYVSCNPATLARDLRILADGGYRVEEVQPVDMFPMTGHVECVVSIYHVDK